MCLRDDLAFVIYARGWRSAARQVAHRDQRLESSRSPASRPRAFKMFRQYHPTLILLLGLRFVVMAVSGERGGLYRGEVGAVGSLDPSAADGPLGALHRAVVERGLADGSAGPRTPASSNIEQAAVTSAGAAFSPRASGTPAANGCARARRPSAVDGRLRRRIAILGAMKSANHFTPRTVDRIDDLTWGLPDGAPTQRASPRFPSTLNLTA